MVRPDSIVFGTAGVGRLKYPRHPFSPQFCKALSCLPVGPFNVVISELLPFERANILVQLVEVRDDVALDQQDNLYLLQGFELSLSIPDARLNFLECQTLRIIYITGFRAS